MIRRFTAQVSDLLVETSRPAPLFTVHVPSQAVTDVTSNASNKLRNADPTCVSMAPFPAPISSVGAGGTA
ncbi:hypothetical protein [Falsiruegeria litorea]|uniref:hypothetical protein n=1 Tax=Falsiruegeria litorea TaxID=1280831 RepID=UPI001A983602|nr:hypothetical protein [Falsiruegeria litorea]